MAENAVLTRFTLVDRREGRAWTSEEVQYGWYKPLEFDVSVYRAGSSLRVETPSGAGYEFEVRPTETGVPRWFDCRTNEAAGVTLRFLVEDWPVGATIEAVEGRNGD